MAVEPPPRTVFEAELRRRAQTAEEFSEYAETYARAHGIPATLSPRHVQRLAAGKGPHGQPLGPLRPGTRRLLAAMFGRPISELLAPTNGPAPADSSPLTDACAELRARLDAARGIDLEAVALFQSKLDLTRTLDRRLGALGLLGELRELISQIEEVLRHTLRPDIRRAIARVLVDASTLAGWQSLDRAQITDAWRHYNRAKAAAREAESADLEAYASAAQSVVLLDLARPGEALDLTDHARDIVGSDSPPLLQSWLAAASGEARAAADEARGSRKAFDDADRLMPAMVDGSYTPYLVLDRVHLGRWRGAALSCLGDRSAVGILIDAKKDLDTSFVRAETSLEIDLARILMSMGERERAAEHALVAHTKASILGSVRQTNRLAALGAQTR